MTYPNLPGLICISRGLTRIVSFVAAVGVVAGGAAPTAVAWARDGRDVAVVFLLLFLFLRVARFVALME